ncbi:MAG: hypothetical protein JO103_09795 [Candidatus Eremiobacteraeota bacterium]|nr:hypothetical protein [Candidatus Eremiobacteraeota bacterium]MBV9407836.1 hypothetical protein [Candidatus Eremiobacteraeota bacterium]
MVEAAIVRPGGSSARSAIETIARTTPLLDPAIPCEDVLRRFIDGDEPAFGVDLGARLGYIDRASCTALFARRFGHELHARRPVASIADPAPFAAECDEDVTDVSARLVRDRPDALYTGFLLTRDGAYAGVATGGDLMHAVADTALTTLEALREAQRSLVDAEKLASLGGLVAGIAHEINTPVGVALTAATQLVEEVRATRERLAQGTLRRSDFEAFLDTVEEGTGLAAMNAARAAELVLGFKQIAVDQSSDERRAFLLADYVRDIVTSLRPEYKHRPVTFELDVDRAIVVDVRPGAIAQIITNLIVNALTHAFPRDGGGTIEIAARFAFGEVVLTFADDGRGIAPAVQERIFEPFFTTDRANGGSGLGLSIVRTLATHALAGSIAVDTAPGAGTRFTLRFPAVTPEASDAG